MHVEGDTAAFGELVRRHQDRLWAVALRTTGDRDDAADALQDALIKAFRAAPGFRGQSAVTTWLHRIVVNACLDRMRANARETAVADVDEATQRSHQSAPSPRVAPSVTTGDPAEAVVRSETLITAMRALDPDQRAVLVLVDMYAYPVAEVAEILGCPQGTVKSRAARGRAHLTRILRGQRNQPQSARVPPEAGTAAQPPEEPLRPPHERLPRPPETADPAKEAR